MSEQSTNNGEGPEGRAVHLAASIKALREPYRQNAIHFLERCTARQFDDVGEDLAKFLGSLDPDMCEAYYLNLKLVLDHAVHHFGGVA